MIRTGVIGLGLFWLFCIHIIQEGHIGIYTRGGALLSGISEPGINFALPLLTQVHQVQVTLQTDKVTNIPCGTSSGVVIMFEKIEVVNRLQKNLAWETIKNYTVHYDKTWIFDKIHHEINQFCSSHTLQDVLIDKFDQLDDALQNALQDGCNKHAPGIEIIAVRVTKPTIPDNILQNYEKREVQKIQLLVQRQEQLIKQKTSETEKLIKIIEAETQANISKIIMQRDIIIKEGKQKIQEIQNQIDQKKSETLSKINDYQIRLQSEINKLKFTPQYRVETSLQAINVQQKYFYGQSINEFFQQNLQIADIDQM